MGYFCDPTGSGVIRWKTQMSSMIKPILGLACALFLALPLAAQDDADVLFTVAGEPVTVGEFRYIYQKTNGEEADFSRGSVMEYLDLYERFKLKVARARDMGLDTVAALQTELEGYRKQLADNYLMDREVTDKLVATLYDRQRRDVDFSHILLTVSSPEPADTLEVYQRANALMEGLTADNFAERARENSDDAYSKARGGRIGFVSAPLPRGMYRLEEALYTAGDGEVVGPVRTPAGYHVVLRHGSRPAYGEVEVAHVLIRRGEDTDPAAARARAEAARKELLAGKAMAEVAAEYSEDEKTRPQGGYIGFFGINRYNKSFEEAAFALEKDGAVSPVVESPAGYHVIQRISRRGVQPLDVQRPLLEAAVRQDTRYADAQQALMQRLEREYGTETMEANLDAYVAGLDGTFFGPDAALAPAGDDAVLLKIGDRELHGSDFADYLRQNARLRGSLERGYEVDDAARLLFDNFKNNQVQAYAEAQLEAEFPEFRALMREYREGILLFEATKLEVWDKAGEDTTGLKEYFAAHRDDYRFGPRAVVATYTVTAPDGGAEAVAEYIGNHDRNEVMDFYGAEQVTVSEEAYEEERLPEGLQLTVGSRTARAEPGDRVQVQLVTAVEAARQKELQEARGYVIADYQDELEREWVEQLRKEYEVKRNKRVLAKLIAS